MKIVNESGSWFYLNKILQTNDHKRPYLERPDSWNKEIIRIAHTYMTPIAWRPLPVILLGDYNSIADPESLPAILCIAELRVYWSIDRRKVCFYNVSWLQSDFIPHISDEIVSKLYLINAQENSTFLVP